MTTYIDSSALVAVYVPERYPALARRTLRTVPQVPYTRLHELEVANAFALLLGRGSITAAEHRAIGAQVRDDVEAQRLRPTATVLTCSLDLLHVAAAGALECTVFVSADDRQLAAAKAAGLKAIDIKRFTARSPRR